MDRIELFSRLRRERSSAISPIIATLLLILIAIAAGVVVYAYVLGFVGSNTNGSAPGTSQLSIDTSSGSSASNTVTAFFRNIGGSAAIITSVYVLDTTGTPVLGGSVIGTASSPVTGCTITSTTTTMPCSISPSATGSISLSSVTLTKGNTYQIKIDTQDGSSVSQSFKAS
jgi:archaeal type IV pilus assembly protein PilA